MRLSKIEGYIQRIETKDSVLNAFGGNDSLITSSAILSAVSGSVSLGAQTVFLASSSKLRTDTVIIEIDGKIYIGKFHRSMLVENEYVICVVRHIEKNIYEVYSVLSPKSGILYMQVGMGAAVEPAKKSAKSGFYWVYISSSIIFIFIFIYAKKMSFDSMLILFIILILGYFTFYFLIKSAVDSTLHLCELSEKIFEKYGFKDPENIYLLSGRFTDMRDRRVLESVYEYRRVIKEDPYPESYITSKTKK
jgi:hypothetical protein